MSRLGAPSRCAPNRHPKENHCPKKEIPVTAAQGALYTEYSLKFCKLLYVSHPFNNRIPYPALTYCNADPTSFLASISLKSPATHTAFGLVTDAPTTPTCFDITPPPFFDIAPYPDELGAFGPVALSWDRSFNPDATP